MERKILLILIFIIGIVSISAVNAIENSENTTASDVSKVDAGISDINETTQSELSENDEIKSLTLTASKLSTTYKSGKSFKVKVTDSESKKSVSNVKITLKVFTGNKYKKITVKSDAYGIARYPASDLSIGKHKVTINVKDLKHYSSKEKSSLIKISKAKPAITAPKITAYYKESKKYTITIKNKESKKPMKGIRVSVKVYTGKKYKKYSLKTDKNGTAGFNMKPLTKSNHKVVIKVKATSRIKSAFSKTYIKTVARPKVIKLRVNSHVLNVKLEDNSAAKTLMNHLKNGDVTVYAEDYGNFEKVGNLGFSLPRSDEYITTSPGDIVLYDGDEISLFYNSNSWSYTKLGKVEGVKDLKNILGNGDVTLVLSLK